MKGTPCRAGVVTLVTLAVVCTALVGGAGGAVLPAATVGSTGSTGHGAENGNYTVSLPFDSDHYPRSKNPGGPYNASINHFAASTPEIFEKIGAPKGLQKLSFIVIENQDIDFSKCSSDNTAAFGIDRGNNDSGTKTDVALLPLMEASYFNDHSIIVDFYDGPEFSAPGDAPVQLYPNDEIVAHQGYLSADGPCYGMPKDPGWYQIQGYANGTAFNGNDVELSLPSHYFYICVCDTEREAYKKLGAPPGQENPYAETPTPTDSPTPTRTADGGSGSGNGEDTPTATRTPTPTPTDTPTPTATRTPTPTNTPTATKTQTSAQETPTKTQQPGGETGGDGDGATPTKTQQSGGGNGGGGSNTGPNTPAATSGPGFGVVGAVLGLLAAALLATRRT